MLMPHLHRNQRAVTKPFLDLNAFAGNTRPLVTTG